MMTRMSPGRYSTLRAFGMPVQLGGAKASGEQKLGDREIGAAPPESPSLRTRSNARRM